MGRGCREVDGITVTTGDIGRLTACEAHKEANSIMVGATGRDDTGGGGGSGAEED